MTENDGKLDCQLVIEMIERTWVPIRGNLFSGSDFYESF